MGERRKLIRNKVVGLLTNTTDAKDKVFSSRVIPNRKEDLPAINVYTPGELVTDNGEAPLLNDRDLNLVCEIVVSDTEDANAADRADDIAEQIEQILFLEDANTKGVLGCLIEKIRLTGMTSEYRSEGESTIISCRLSFSAAYMKEAVTTAAKDTSELDRLGVDWDVGTASDPDPEATDKIELGP